MSPNDLNDTFDWFYLLATLDIISIASHVWHSFHHDLRYISFDIAAFEHSYVLFKKELLFVFNLIHDSVIHLDEYFSCLIS